MKNIFYSIKTKNKSAKAICQEINKALPDHNTLQCYDFGEQGIFIEGEEDGVELKEKLERILEIELGDPEEEQKVEE